MVAPLKVASNRPKADSTASAIAGTGVERTNRREAAARSASRKASSTPAATPSSVQYHPANVNNTLPPTVQAFMAMITSANHETDRSRFRMSRAPILEPKNPAMTRTDPAMRPGKESRAKRSRDTHSRTAPLARGSSRKSNVLDFPSICLILSS